MHSPRSPTPAWGAKSEVAAPPLPSRRPTNGQKCHITPGFLAVPNTSLGDKIRSGCLNPTFSGAQKRAEILCHPCILGDPKRQRGEQSQKSLPHARLLEGPKEGGNALSPLHSLGSPTRARGTKSEVAASPLPSQGPRNGCKCYVSLAFSAVLNTKRGDKLRRGCVTLAFSEARERAEVLRHPCNVRGTQCQCR